MDSKMQSFKLKDSSSGECRRFRLPVQDDLFASLTHQVKTLFNLSEEPRLFYFDEDKDRIEVGSQIELEAAVFSFPNLLVLEVGKSKEEERERPCRGRGGRGGCGRGRGGWKGKWRAQMEGASEEERQEMWKQRKIEMLKWKLERLTQKLLFVEDRIKQTGEEGEKGNFWVIQRTVLSAKKEYVERCIEHLSNKEATNEDDLTDNTNKWKNMKTRRLNFRLKMITNALDALHQLPEQNKATEAYKQKTSRLEAKKERIQNKIARMEGGELTSGGCPMGWFGRWDMYPHRHLHAHPHSLHHPHPHPHPHPHGHPHGHPHPFPLFPVMGPYGIEEEKK